MEIAEKRARTCCFTGHRQIPPEERAELAGRLERTVASLYRRGVRYAGEQGLAVINIARGRTRVPRETGAENHPACRIPPANGVILTVPDPLFSYADHASASPVIRRR